MNVGAYWPHVWRYATHPQELAKNALYWQRAGLSEQAYIFILGAPRSGTTLMQRVIGLHSKVVSYNGETKILTPKSVFDYSRFSGFVSRACFDRVLASSSDIVSFFDAFHRLGLAGDCAYYLEKTPEHVKRLGFIVRHFPHARILHMVRDPRDCCASAMTAGDGLIPQATSAATYARYWVRCMDGRSQAASSASIRDVRYEEFVSDPEAQLQGIMDWLGLACEPEQLQTSRIADDARSGEAAFARLATAISPASVGRWKAILSDRQVADVERICGPWMRHYGYA